MVLELGGFTTELLDGTPQEAGSLDGIKGHHACCSLDCLSSALLPCRPVLLSPCDPALESSGN